MSVLEMSLYFIIVLSTSVSMVAMCGEDEQRLFEHLFEGQKRYDPRVCPSKQGDGPLQVNISMHMLKLQEVNTKFQYISVVGWITAQWVDYRLQWNESEFGGIDTVNVPTPDVWIPTFVLANTASEYLYNEFWYSLFKVIVHSDGRMKWAPGGIFKADCPIDVHFFPFDEQICQFRFENWIYTGDKVNLSYVPNADKQFLSFYSIENGQWDVVQVQVARRDKYFLESRPFPSVHFGIHVRRKSLFYVTNIILLSVMLAVLVLFIFKLPAESGERVSMGVTLLLAFSVFVLMINDSIPETSSAVPIIIVYLICFMALTTLGICESVFVLYCYHHNGEHRAPACMVRFFMHCMGKSCCQRRLDKNTELLELNEHHRPKGCCNGTDSGSMDKDRAKELCRLEWQQISRQIDVFCFWMFLVVFLLLVWILLVLLPSSFGNKDMDTVVQHWINS